MADLTAVLIQTGKPSPLAQHRRKFTALAPNGQISAEVSGFGDSFRIFYGARGRRNNVEGSLIQAIRADRLNLLMNSANMGGDPYPAQSKELLVCYSWQGREFENLTHDDSLVSLPNSKDRLVSGK